MDYKHEYGRYKERAKRLNDSLKEAREAIKAMEQTNQASLALVGAVLAAFKVEEDSAIILDREAVSAAVKGLRVRCDYDPEKKQYRLWVEKNEK